MANFNISSPDSVLALKLLDGALTEHHQQTASALAADLK